LVEEVIQMEKAIEMAEVRTAYVTSDKEALCAYEMRQMALSDWTSGVNYTRREGKKEGLAEDQKKGLVEGEKKGRKEGKEGAKRAIACNLKALGVSVGQIAQATGLSEAEIVRL
jgi:predicted transposase/invertase (TIGR01784 family)